MALLAYLRKEDEKGIERDWQQLRTRLLVHGIKPEQIPEVLEALEGKRREDEFGPEHAQELTDEEMENYMPLSVTEAEQAIAQLRQFGVAVQDTTAPTGWES